MRNDSMRFPSGDFSNVTIAPKKSITIENTEIKQFIEKEVIDSATFTKETISQKEIDSSKLKEKIEDGEKSPDLVKKDEKDIAEATLKDKISSFESKMSKEPSIDIPKSTIKLTKEALKKHTLDHDQGLEYTQEFVREQSNISNFETHVETKQEKVVNDIVKQEETVKSVKETIQHFDSKIKHDEKRSKSVSKAMRTDSTLVQVSSEEDSEFLKKSTDSETETESQTTVKIEKDGERLKGKGEMIDKNHSKSEILLPKIDKQDKPKKGDDSKKDDDSSKDKKLQRQLTEELRKKVSEEELTETFEEKDVSITERNKVTVGIYNSSHL